MPGHTTAALPESQGSTSSPCRLQAGGHRSQQPAAMELVETWSAQHPSPPQLELSSAAGHRRFHPAKDLSVPWPEGEETSQSAFNPPTPEQLEQEPREKNKGQEVRVPMPHTPHKSSSCSPAFPTEGEKTPVSREQPSRPLSGPQEVGHCFLAKELSQYVARPNGFARQRQECPF